jgi:hypothetical protein
LKSFEEELTYAFGGSSIVRGIEGSYLSASGERTPDQVNLLYSDAPLALSTDFPFLGGLRAGAKKRGHGSSVRRNGFDFS